MQLLKLWRNVFNRRVWMTFLKFKTVAVNCIQMFSSVQNESCYIFESTTLQDYRGTILGDSWLISGVVKRL